MKRPDLDTLACVNPECQLFHRAGASNLIIRKVYGHDRIRLLRCRTCGEECSERRGSALFNTGSTQLFSPAPGLVMQAASLRGWAAACIGAM